METNRNLGCIFRCSSPCPSTRTTCSRSRLISLLMCMSRSVLHERFGFNQVCQVLVEEIKTTQNACLCVALALLPTLLPPWPAHLPELAGDVQGALDGLLAHGRSSEWDQAVAVQRNSFSTTGSRGSWLPGEELAEGTQKCYGATCWIQIPLQARPQAAVHTPYCDGFDPKPAATQHDGMGPRVTHSDP